MNSQKGQVRRATSADIDDLLALEAAAFSGDRISKRRFKHWINADNGLLLVMEVDQSVQAYVLILLRRNKRLARLYSLAVCDAARGQGLGLALLSAAEKMAADMGWLFMRLEVAKNNERAIRLYQKMGYQVFGEYPQYYEDQQDALRMEKSIQSIEAL